MLCYAMLFPGAGLAQLVMARLLEGPEASLVSGTKVRNIMEGTKARNIMISK